MDQKFIDLYDDYNCGLLDRRQFIVKLALFSGGMAMALALLPYLENNYALAAMVPENDPRIRAASITHPGIDGELRAYQVQPEGEAKIPAVLVIHEIWGLNPHIEDVTRRLGVEGFLAMAPDALTPLGGTPEDADKARSMVMHLDQQTTIKNYLAAEKYLQTHPRSNGNVGVVGFCWGGGMANQLAVHSPQLKAAAPFYGPQPASEDVPKIKASLLLHYAGLDERVNAGIPAFEAALKKAFIDYKIYMYEGAQHAFNNDTNPSRYNKEVAQLAWQRTIAFFKEKLKT
jgi:carboxymethylenebutenolidase